MAVVLGPEDLHGRLALGQGGDEVGLRGLPVGVEIAGAQRLALAHAGVDDDPVQAAQLGAERTEHVEHLVVVVHVQGFDQHGDARVGLFQFRFQGVQLVGAPRAQGQVAAPGGEQPRHAGAQTGAGAGDENIGTGTHGIILVACVDPGSQRGEEIGQRPVHRFGVFYRRMVPGIGHRDQPRPGDGVDDALRFFRRRCPVQFADDH